MAAQRYIALLAGKLKQVAATVTSAGAGDDGKIVALDTTGRLHTSLMPVGVTPEVTMAEASENLSAGDFVSIYNDLGTPKARKADASSEGKEAVGYVLDAVSTGQEATVYHEGANTALSGLTPGTRYYLSDSTPGGAQSSPVSGAGKVSQFLGTSTTATKLIFEADDGIVLA